MGARDTLSTLAAAGLSVELKEGRLIVKPRELLTDAMRDAIRAQRDELAAELSALPTLAVLAAAPAEGELPRNDGSTCARIYPLTREQAEESDGHHWAEDTIAMFHARVKAIVTRGFEQQEAEDLAENLKLRDDRGDDRRMCLECSHLGSSIGRCIAASAGRLEGADRRMTPVATVLHRCEAFGLRKNLD